MRADQIIKFAWKLIIGPGGCGRCHRCIRRAASVHADAYHRKLNNYGAKYWLRAQMYGTCVPDCACALRRPCDGRNNWNEIELAVMVFTISNIYCRLSAIGWNWSRGAIAMSTTTIAFMQFSIDDALVVFVCIAFFFWFRAKHDAAHWPN